jgi:hypothetical protein
MVTKWPDQPSRSRIRGDAATRFAGGDAEHDLGTARQRATSSAMPA